MNLRRKQLILEIANERRTGISASKGPEYAGSASKYGDDDQDVLANFKRQGQRWGTSPLLPAGIYAGKHIDSLETFIREVTAPNVDLPAQRRIAQRGEGIVSRLDDLRNYCDLLECLLVELEIVQDPSRDTFIEPHSRTEVIEQELGILHESVPVSPGLREIGPITGADVQTAVAIDGGHELAEDYNYLRERVQELQREERSVTQVAP